MSQLGSLDESVANKVLPQLKKDHSLPSKYTSLLLEIQEVQKQNDFLESGLIELINSNKRSPQGQLISKMIEFEQSFEKMQKYVEEVINTLKDPNRLGNNFVESSINGDKFGENCQIKLLLNDFAIMNMDSNEIKLKCDNLSTLIQFLEQKLESKRQINSLMSKNLSKMQTNIEKQYDYSHPMFIRVEEQRYKIFKLKKRLVCLLKTRKELQKAKKEKKNLAAQCKIQHNAACVIQRNIRRYMAIRKVTKMHKAAITIQRVWRGYLQRKEIMI